MFELPENVTLIAVTKSQPVEKIDWALAQGLRHFGENRVQEAMTHWQEKRKDYPDLILHLIGPLQSNKVKEAVALFNVIQTLDRPKIAKTLAEEMQKQNRFLSCFIQVNIGDEQQKSGIAVSELSGFFDYCTKELKLNVIGLMAIPPLDKDPVPYFKQMKNLQKQLGLTELSMGMSSDYRKAIDCGATFVRIGTALFNGR